MAEVNRGFTQYTLGQSPPNAGDYAGFAEQQGFNIPTEEPQQPDLSFWEKLWSWGDEDDKEAWETGLKRIQEAQAGITPPDIKVLRDDFKFNEDWSGSKEEKQKRLQAGIARGYLVPMQNEDGGFDIFRTYQDKQGKQQRELIPIARLYRTSGDINKVAYSELMLPGNKNLDIKNWRDHLTKFARQARPEDLEGSDSYALALSHPLSKAANMIAGVLYGDEYKTPYEAVRGNEEYEEAKAIPQTVGRILPAIGSAVTGGAIASSFGAPAAIAATIGAASSAMPAVMEYVEGYATDTETLGSAATKSGIDIITSAVSGALGAKVLQGFTKSAVGKAIENVSKFTGINNSKEVLKAILKDQAILPTFTRYMGMFMAQETVINAAQVTATMEVEKKRTGQDIPIGSEQWWSSMVEQTAISMAMAGFMEGLSLPTMRQGIRSGIAEQFPTQWRMAAFKRVEEDFNYAAPKFFKAAAVPEGANEAEYFASVVDNFQRNGYIDKDPEVGNMAFVTLAQMNNLLKNNPNLKFEDANIRINDIDDNGYPVVESKIDVADVPDGAAQMRSDNALDYSVFDKSEDLARIYSNGMAEQIDDKTIKQLQELGLVRKPEKGTKVEKPALFMSTVKPGSKHYGSIFEAYRYLTDDKETIKIAMGDAEAVQKWIQNNPNLVEQYKVKQDPLNPGQTIPASEGEFVNKIITHNIGKIAGTIKSAVAETGGIKPHYFDRDGAKFMARAGQGQDEPGVNEGIRNILVRNDAAASFEQIWDESIAKLNEKYPNADEGSLTKALYNLIKEAFGISGTGKADLKKKFINKFAKQDNIADPRRIIDDANEKIKGDEGKQRLVNGEYSPLVKDKAAQSISGPRVPDSPLIPKTPFGAEIAGELTDAPVHLYRGDEQLPWQEAQRPVKGIPPGTTEGSMLPRFELADELGRPIEPDIPERNPVSDYFDEEVTPQQAAEMAAVMEAANRARQTEESVPQITIEEGEQPRTSSINKDTKVTDLLEEKGFNLEQDDRGLTWDDVDEIVKFDYMEQKSMKKTTNGAKTTIKNIINHKNTSKEQKAIAKLILTFVNEDLDIETISGPRSQYRVSFLTKNKIFENPGSIIIGEEYFAKSYPDHVIYNILHEVLHSITTPVITAAKRAPHLLSKKALKAVKELEGLRLLVKDTIPNTNLKPGDYLTIDNNLDKIYALKNSEEFIAELSNPHFRNILKNIYIGKETALKRIWRNILEVLKGGYKVPINDSAYAKLMNLVNIIATEQKTNTKLIDQKYKEYYKNFYIKLTEEEFLEKYRPSIDDVDRVGDLTAFGEIKPFKYKEGGPEPGVMDDPSVPDKFELMHETTLEIPQIGSRQTDAGGNKTVLFDGEKAYNYQGKNFGKDKSKIAKSLGYTTEEFNNKLKNGEIQEGLLTKEGEFIPQDGIITSRNQTTVKKPQAAKAKKAAQKKARPVKGLAAATPEARLQVAESKLSNATATKKDFDELGKKYTFDELDEALSKQMAKANAKKDKAMADKIDKAMDRLEEWHIEREKSTKKDIQTIAKEQPDLGATVFGSVKEKPNANNAKTAPELIKSVVKNSKHPWAKIISRALQPLVSDNYTIARYNRETNRITNPEVLSPNQLSEAEGHLAKDRASAFMNRETKYMVLPEDATTEEIIHETWHTVLADKIHLYRQASKMGEYLPGMEDYYKLVNSIKALRKVVGKDSLKYAKDRKYKAGEIDPSDYVMLDEDGTVLPVSDIKFLNDVDEISPYMLSNPAFMRLAMSVGYNGKKLKSPGSGKTMLDNIKNIFMRFSGLNKLKDWIGIKKAKQVEKTLFDVIGGSSLRMAERSIDEIDINPKVREAANRVNNEFHNLNANRFTNNTEAANESLKTRFGNFIGRTIKGHKVDTDVMMQGVIGSDIIRSKFAEPLKSAKAAGDKNKIAKLEQDFDRAVDAVTRLGKTIEKHAVGMNLVSRGNLATSQMQKELAALKKELKVLGIDTYLLKDVEKQAFKGGYNYGLGGNEARAVQTARNYSSEFNNDITNSYSTFKTGSKKIAGKIGISENRVQSTVADAYIDLSETKHDIDLSRYLGEEEKANLAKALSSREEMLRRLQISSIENDQLRRRLQSKYYHAIKDNGWKPVSNDIFNKIIGEAKDQSVDNIKAQELILMHKSFKDMQMAMSRSYIAQGSYAHEVKYADIDSAIDEVGKKINTYTEKKKAAQAEVAKLDEQLKLLEKDKTIDSKKIKAIKNKRNKLNRELRKIETREILSEKTKYTDLKNLAKIRDRADLLDYMNHRWDVAKQDRPFGFYAREVAQQPVLDKKGYIFTDKYVAADASLYKNMSYYKSQAARQQAFKRWKKEVGATDTKDGDIYEINAVDKYGELIRNDDGSVKRIRVKVNLRIDNNETAKYRFSNREKIMAALWSLLDKSGAAPQAYSAKTSTLKNLYEQFDGLRKELKKSQQELLDAGEDATESADLDFIQQTLDSISLIYQKGISEGDIDPVFISSHLTKLLSIAYQPPIARSRKSTGHTGWMPEYKDLPKFIQRSTNLAGKSITDGMRNAAHYTEVTSQLGALHELGLHNTNYGKILEGLRNDLTFSPGMLQGDVLITGQSYTKNFGGRVTNSAKIVRTGAQWAALAKMLANNPAKLRNNIYAVADAMFASFSPDEKRANLKALAKLGKNAHVLIKTEMVKALGYKTKGSKDFDVFMAEHGIDTRNITKNVKQLSGNPIYDYFMGKAYSSGVFTKTIVNELVAEGAIPPVVVNVGMIPTRVAEFENRMVSYMAEIMRLTSENPRGKMSAKEYIDKYGDEFHLRASAFSDNVNGTFAIMDRGAIERKVARHAWGRAGLPLLSPAINSLNTYHSAWVKAARSPNKLKSYSKLAGLHVMASLIKGPRGVLILGTVMNIMDFLDTADEDKDIVQRSWLDEMHNSLYNTAAKGMGISRKAYDSFAHMLEHGLISTWLNKNMSTEESYQQFLNPVLASDVSKLIQNVKYKGADELPIELLKALLPTKIKDIYRIGKSTYTGKAHDWRNNELNKREYGIGDAFREFLFGKDLEDYMAITKEAGAKVDLPDQQVDYVEKLLNLDGFSINAPHGKTDEYKSKVTELLYSKAPELKNRLIDIYRSDVFQKAVDRSIDKFEKFKDKYKDQWMKLMPEPLTAEYGMADETSELFDTYEKDIRAYYISAANYQLLKDELKKYNIKPKFTFTNKEFLAPEDGRVYKLGQVEDFGLQGYYYAIGQIWKNLEPELKRRK